MKFIIYKDKNREWRWQLKAGNGEIIAHGEGYKNKKGCLHAISLVRISHGAEVSFEK